MKTIIVLALITFTICDNSDKNNYGDPTKGCNSGEVKVCFGQPSYCACTIMADNDGGCPMFSYNQDKPVPGTQIVDAKKNEWCMLSCSPMRGCYGKGECYLVEKNTVWKFEDGMNALMKWGSDKDLCVYEMNGEYKEIRDLTVIEDQ